MSQVYVKLKDGGSIFLNVEKGETITGRGAKLMTVTDRLTKAIQGGMLEELKEEDAQKLNHQLGLSFEPIGHANDGNADSIVVAEAEPATEIEKPKKAK